MGRHDGEAHCHHRKRRGPVLCDQQLRRTGLHRGGRRRLAFPELHAMCDMVLNDVTLEWDENGELITDTENLLRGTMIGDYSGIFDGNGHTITGMVIDSENQSTVGFIRALENDGRVQNTTIDNSDIDLRGTYIGCVVGESKGIIENCHVNTCRGKNTFAGRISLTATGGVVGGSIGIVKNCTNHAWFWGDLMLAE